MEYKNSKVTDEILPEGVTQLYQGHIVHADAVGNDVLGQRIARRLKIDPAVACNILNAYATEFLDYIIACRVVDDIDEAIDHIAKYSTGHSECIVTADYNNARKFTQLVDSAAVYVNASTRFTDGGVFGLGAEIGISTQKLHARGPMGLNELTSMKFIIEGCGQIRE